jgi:hypothetical protein
MRGLAVDLTRRLAVGIELNNLTRPNSRPYAENNNSSFDRTYNDLQCHELQLRHARTVC